MRFFVRSCNKVSLYDITSIKSQHWIIEVVHTKYSTEAWLHNESFGIKVFMMGIPEPDISDATFLLAIEKYVKPCIEEYKQIVQTISDIGGDV